MIEAASSMMFEWLRKISCNKGTHSWIGVGRISNIGLLNSHLRIRAVNDILWIDTPYSRCWKGGCISIGDEECVASRDRKITVTYDASCVGTTFLGRMGSTLISLTRL